MFRKRVREPEVSEDNSHAIGRERIIVHCGSEATCLSLHEPILNSFSLVDAERFPGLLFYFDVEVLSLDTSGTTVVRLVPSAHTHQLLSCYNGKACPVHGPFRCSCRRMHLAADNLRKLLAETGNYYSGDVFVDVSPNTPHIFINSLTHSWYVKVLGSEFPNFVFGPFHLSPADVPSQILSIWHRFQILEAKQQTTSPCAHCGHTTTSFCVLCRCFLCSACSQPCLKCERSICHACCSYVENCGSAICYSCMT